MQAPKLLCRSHKAAIAKLRNSVKLGYLDMASVWIFDAITNLDTELNRLLIRRFSDQKYSSALFYKEVHPILYLFLDTNCTTAGNSRNSSKETRVVSWYAIMDACWSCWSSRTSGSSKRPIGGRKHTSISKDCFRVAESFFLIFYCRQLRKDPHAR